MSEDVVGESDVVGSDAEQHAKGRPRKRSEAAKGGGASAALRSHRVEKGLMQQDIADLFGVSQSYMCQLERGSPYAKAWVVRNLETLTKIYGPKFAEAAGVCPACAGSCPSCGRDLAY